jgi:transposase
VQRWLFLRELDDLPDNVPVYFLDESGVDHRLHRPWGRAARGEVVYTDTPGSRRGRTSIISACKDGRLVQPLLFEGHCDTEVVDTYFETLLLPSIPRWSVIILDNARFHCSASTQALVEQAGCFLMYLPAYSPDLNPIEHVWAALKKALQRGLQKAKDIFLFISDMCLCYC